MQGKDKNKFWIAAGVVLSTSVIIFLIFNTLFFVSRGHRSLMPDVADRLQPEPLDKEQGSSVFSANRTEKRFSDSTNLSEEKISSLIALIPNAEPEFKPEETQTKIIEERVKSSLFIHQRTRESFEAQSSIGALTVIHSFT